MLAVRAGVKQLLHKIASYVKQFLGHETTRRHAAPNTTISSADAAGPQKGGKASAAGLVTVADGVVSFRDGQFHITDALGGGLPPVLVPGDDVILTIDGLEVTKPVSVWAGRAISVRPRLSASPVREYEIRVSPDRMSAYLAVKEPGPPGYRVRDAGPAHVISLAAEPLPGLQANPTAAELEQALQAAGVVMGLDPSAVEKALATSGPACVQVALGRPAEPGTPGRVESQLQEPPEDSPWRLGLRVEPGQPLARLIPPREGQAGFDVTGNPLQPPPLPVCGLVVGYGATLAENGTEAIATLAGRPVLIEMGTNVYRAAVVPVAELAGPLTGAATPYRFEGDVVIDGNVEGGIDIQAGGWIWVRGSVHDATLEAGQGIWVERSVKWSRLITRATRKRLITLQRQFSRIVSDLRQMRDYANLIISHPRYAELAQVRSFGEVMLLLAHEKFEHLGQRIHQARETLSDLTVLQTQLDLEAVLNALEYRLHSGSMQSVDDLTEFIDSITAATQRAVDILGAGGDDAPVHAHVLIGSSVDADGDVIVHGPGAEQTVVKARGRVQATSLRDVRVISGEAIEAGSAVASFSGSLLLEVSPGGSIHVGKAYRDIRLKVGNWDHVLAPDSRNVLVRSDADGRIHLGYDRTPNTDGHLSKFPSTPFRSHGEATSPGGLRDHIEQPGQAGA